LARLKSPTTEACGSVITLAVANDPAADDEKACDVEVEVDVDTDADGDADADVDADDDEGNNDADSIEDLEGECGDDEGPDNNGVDSDSSMTTPTALKSESAYLFSSLSPILLRAVSSASNFALIQSTTISKTKKMKPKKLTCSFAWL
jgi:hypothetical protein